MGEEVAGVSHNDAVALGVLCGIILEAIVKSGIKRRRKADVSHADLLQPHEQMLAERLGALPL